MKNVFLISLFLLGIAISDSHAACDEPDGLRISNLTGTSVTLHWNASGDAKEYEVEIEDGDNTPSFNREFQTSQTSVNVDGLTPGGEYKFKVKSECSSGSSDHSPWFFFNASNGDSGNPGGGDDNSGSCNMPDGLSISNNNGTSVTLSWNAAEGAVRYEVEIEDGDNTPPFNKEFKTTQTSASVDGLTPGGEYKFKVKSECSSGSSDHSPLFFFVAGDSGSGNPGGGDDNSGSCHIPGGLSISNNNGTSVTLSWNAVEGAVRYEVEIEDGDNTPPFNKEFKTTQTSATVDGLTPGGEYKFKVKSECSSGSSDHSPLFFFVAGDSGSGNPGGGDDNSGSCNIPVGLSISNNNGTSVTLSWNAAEGAVRYEVEIEDGDNTPPFNKEFKTTQTSASVDGLTAGGEYKFKVKSECSSGSSDHSPLFFFIAGDSGSGNPGGGDDNSGSCNIPDGLSISNNNGTSVTLSWNAAEGAVRYEVEIEDGDNTPPFNKEFKTMQTSATVDGLTPGGEYKFKVKSECTSGSSDHSPLFFFVAGSGDSGNPGGGSCDIPEGLDVVTTNGSIVTLFWTAVSGALQYEVEIENGENTPLFTQQFKTTQIEAQIGGLTAGGTYKFKVKSECSSGSSDFSPLFFFVAGSNDTGNPGGGSTINCGVPNGLLVSNITGTSATLQWETVSGVNRYEIEIEDDENTPVFSQVLFSNENSVVVTGLSAGGNYQFKVKSECSSGSSDFSPWAFFTTSTQVNQNIVNINTFPNPVSNLLKVSLGDLKFEGKVMSEMIDLSGRVVWKQSFDDGKTVREFEVPVQNLSEGFYQLKIRSGNHQEKARVFVHH